MFPGTQGRPGRLIVALYCPPKQLPKPLPLPLPLPNTQPCPNVKEYPTSIYVFESKNYSGWIFGDEKSKNWTQTLQNKQKNRFFNPVWQNKGHINALKLATELDNPELYKSYIIFSERCELKKVNITSPNVKVMKRNALIKTIKEDMESSFNFLTIEEVDQLYLKLQRYAHADQMVKKTHIDNIQKGKL